MSRYPILIGTAAFVFLAGVLMGLPVLLLGAALGVLSLVGYTKERFVAKEEPLGERWPFQGVERVKLGVWTFMASEVLFFGVLIGSYLFIRSNSQFWPAVGEVLSIQHGAINTVILLSSSATAVLALAAAKSRTRVGLIGGLLFTFILGSTFLFNKGAEWGELFAHGFTFSSGLPASTYFVTTGVHGAHVAAGLAILVYLLARAIQGRYVDGDSRAVEYFGIYWHFVDIVWVFLFPLFYLL